MSELPNASKNTMAGMICGSGYTGIIHQLQDEMNKMERELDHNRAEIDRLRVERRWIPVSERLPETNRSVLIFNELRLCQVAGHYPDGKWYLQDGAIEWQGVTHWMPLPPPPEKE